MAGYFLLDLALAELGHPMQQFDEFGLQILTIRERSKCLRICQLRGVQKTAAGPLGNNFGRLILEIYEGGGIDAFEIL